MAINTKKVLLGGLAAAVILNVIDYVAFGNVLAARMSAASDAFKPGLGAAMMSGRAIAGYVFTDLALGFLLIWTYAAIRPRFGPGMRTASAAALLFWVIALLYNMPSMEMGMMSTKLWWAAMIIGLANFLIAACVGAWIYSEDDETA